MLHKHQECQLAKKNLNQIPPLTGILPFTNCCNAKDHTTALDMNSLIYCLQKIEYYFNMSKGVGQIFIMHFISY